MEQKNNLFIDKKKDNKEFWYFTFCGCHKQAGFAQCILAEDFTKAREIMVNHYDDKWGFQYSHEQWVKLKLEALENPWFNLEQLLPGILEA